MAKIKYYYDTKTCQYEKVKISKLEMVINGLGIMFICLIFGVIFSVLITKHMPSSRLQFLLNQNVALLQKYEAANRDLKQINSQLSLLQRNDDKVYRVLFDAPPIPDEIRQAGAGGSQKYKDIIEKRLSQESLILSTFNKLDITKRKMYIQTKSYDEIMELAKSKSEMLERIPAIQPIANKELKRLASGFGMRYHPILKIRRMHAGCDFSAKIGTPIYATGDGVVTKVATVRRGYGKHIEITHGYGYKTRYGHMSGFNVVKGQQVKRGQVIGFVGSTGLSSGPHLHYEVHYQNRPVNPVNYFTNGLTKEEADKLLEYASKENASLGF
ncbi:M23 family metallopeptidase [Flammeovirgaceae bacterium SG7u.111]|nr:M23 family metallopeptidase [Flammeovirgaceae bacterium SG7u.132]WPO33082.1 M23 family metallopeptidase [Flammeovirgaceae bacterium SG7u.111]